MRTIKATILAKTLGIPRRTMADLCRYTPGLAYLKNGCYQVRISELAKRPGMDMVAVLTSLDDEWIKAVDLAKLSGIPRRTIAYWCQTRPWFAKRIGRNWYLSREVLGATQEQADFLKKWAPAARSAVKLAETVSELGKNE